MVDRDDAGWITLIERARPDPVAAARYDEVFAIYAGLYPTLAASMAKLSTLRQSDAI